MTLKRAQIGDPTDTVIFKWAVNTYVLYKSLGYAGVPAPRSGSAKTIYLAAIVNYLQAITNMSTLQPARPGESENQLLVRICNLLYDYISGGGATGASFKAGIEALAINDTSKAIVFPTAFADVPVPNAIIIVPAGGDDISYTIDRSTLTTVGMTVNFAAIPSSGYYLAWQVSLPS
jgi:hypothetical protein